MRHPMANLAFNTMEVNADHYLSLQRDAFRFLDAWQSWTVKYGCELQANDGCDKCNLDDWDLDYCPFHTSEKTGE